MSSTMFKPNDHVLKYVDDYLYDALYPPEAGYVEEHCIHCRICQVALEEARKRQVAFESVAPLEPSSQLIATTLERIAAHERRKPIVIRTILAVTAAAVLITAGLHLYFLSWAATSADLRLLGQAVWYTGTQASLRIQLNDRLLGTPLPGVPIDVELFDRARSRRQTLAHFTTNEEGGGEPRFRLPDWPDGRYELRVVAHAPTGEEILVPTIELKRSWKVMLSTDKPVYQPGQTIHARSLVLRRLDLKPVAGQTATFSITDPKSNVIFKQSEVTSIYGITAIDCALATEILEGRYTVACQLGDTETKSIVEVKKYVLPKFKFQVEFNQPYYEPGQSIRCKIRADYLFGKPIVDGRVGVAVSLRPSKPSFAEQLSLRTGAAGEASFELALPPPRTGAESDDDDSVLSVEITVTDSAGQSLTKTATRPVTRNRLRIELVPEGGSLVRGMTNTVYVMATYADGRPAQVRVIVPGLSNEVLTDALGIGAFDFAPNSEEVDWTIWATDGAGPVSRRRVQMKCGTSVLDFILRTDKAVYQSGETITIQAQGGGRQPVFVDLVKDGQTVLTQTIDPHFGQTRCAFDLPPDLFGTVELYAYRLDADGIPVRKSRVLYIKRSSDLNVKAQLDRPEYRPGSLARVSFALTDENGKSSPGAISLGVVDEAVYSILPEPPGAEQAFFARDQALLQPVYDAYPWSPGASIRGTPDQRARFEKVLFARTAKDRSATNREALIRKLLPFVENSRSVFEVFERPDWENLVQPEWFPAGSLELLRSGSVPHTLQRGSYTAKRQQVEADKNTALGVIHKAWGGVALLGLVLLMALLYQVSRAMPTLVEILIIVMIVGILTALMLPAVQKVREASNRIRSANQLHEIGLAFENMLESEGRLPSLAEEPHGTPAVRLREWFPETLLWRPELITDGTGHATIDFDLADSITSWHLSAGAVTADGRLGGAQADIKAFQPFFVDVDLPATLTRLDEVAVPVVVYNYLNQTQLVELTLADGPCFQRRDEAVKQVTLTPNQVSKVSFRIRATKVGLCALEVTARGRGVGDAIKRQVEVVPEGRRLEQVFNGSLEQRADVQFTVPAQAIAGSPRAILKLYPSAFSQLVEGLDSIFQMPYGCFEQTSSTTYPNVLALDYLLRNHKTLPEVEAKARHYIGLGYQRLLGFEVPGGGFDWFGCTPANGTLTAYGLMEFEDMARVHQVDPKLIERTRTWLLAQRNADGSWSPDGHRLHDDPTGRHAGDSESVLPTTAYIAWSVFSDPAACPQVEPTRSYLLSQRAETIGDPHTLALLCLALASMKVDGASLAPFVERLGLLPHLSEDGKQAWWQPPEGTTTTFYGSGRCASVETTALATLALLQANHSAPVVHKALTWLVAQKDPRGTWQSTQPTVLALKALLAASGKPLGSEQERRLEIRMDGQRQTLTIPSDQGEVLQQIDLSEHLTPGEHHLQLADLGGARTLYQVSFRYHVPDGDGRQTPESLRVSLNYDKTKLAVDDSTVATARVTNCLASPAPMAILELPVPAGFVVESESLEALAPTAAIARYQLLPGHVLFYLRTLGPRQTLELRYRLRATMPVQVTASPGRVYLYYTPDQQAQSLPVRLTVTSP
jgi:uncharacterized protein YfaS (alpha-2-macroglobulin family)